MSAMSLRERVKQLLLENAEPTPGTYFGGKAPKVSKAPRKAPKKSPNPWIEAVKKYGSVAEAKKYYRKGEKVGGCCCECGREY